MLRSMTGYGRGESAVGGKKVIAEVRSVNHRFLDVSVRISRNLLPLENEIKKLVSASVSRGKVDVSIQVESTQNGDLNIHLNKAKAQQVYNLIDEIKKQNVIPEDITLSTLLLFKDIIFEEEHEDVDISDYWNCLKPSVEQAIRSIKQMQDTEGRETSNDMKHRLEKIAETIHEVELNSSESSAKRQDALKERVGILCDGVEIDAARMAQEIAILADRSDITEELVRTKSHIKQLMQWLDSTEEPIGRKLEFLIQEINREVNTMGSKASSSEISLKVVIIKNELEKIREQVQNVM